MEFIQGEGFVKNACEDVDIKDSFEAGYNRASLEEGDIKG